MPLTEYYRKDNRGPSVVVTTVIVTMLSTAFLVFRIISRRIVGSKWDWSDSALLFGYIGALVTSLCGLVAATKGFGRHLAFVVIDGQLENMLLINFAAEQAYLAAITAIKISILLFYWRVFTMKKHRYTIYFVMFLCLAWYVIFQVLLMTACNPVHKWWTDLLACKDPQPDFIASAATNTAIDLGILGIPVWGIAGLGLRKCQKLQVAGLFLTGGIVIIASCGRLKSLTETVMVDITYNYVPAATWSVAEVNLAVISASIPFLQPLGLQIYHIFRPRTELTITDGSSYRPSESRSRRRTSNGTAEKDMRAICPSGGENFTVIESDQDSTKIRDLEAAVIRVDTSTSVSMEIKRTSRAWKEQWEKVY